MAANRHEKPTALATPGPARPDPGVPLMRVVGLMSWFSERPSWLSACISSYAEAGLTHLVAVDGAYAIFPGGLARSNGIEAETIMDVCNGLGLHLTLVRPDVTWQGNEVEKRTAMFRHAEAVCQPGVDWLQIIDADEVVTRALSGWTDELAGTDLDTADVLLWEQEDRDTQPKAQVDRTVVIDPISRSPIRKLFRATPGIHCVANHYTWETPDGRRLWGSHGMVPALDLTDHFHIEHRTAYRSLHRKGASHDYYRRRDAAGVERTV
jgi:hypothetical protein